MADDSPKQIAFCITELDPGGAERALVQLVRRLDRSRWAPVVYCLAGSAPLAAELRKRGVPVNCLGGGGAGSLLVLPRLASRLRRQRPVLLQTFLYHANIVGRIAARIAGVPRVVAGIRVAEKRSRFRLWLDRATDRLVDRHVCVSEAVARFSIEQGKLPTDKVVVIPNGVDADLFRTASPADLTEFGIPPDSRTVLFVGRLDPQKGPIDLLRAFARLSQGRDDVHLLMVGEGPLRGEVEASVESRGLSGRVHLAGWRDDVPRLMKAADCLALSSHWEGMPNVVLEAMAAGLPVVATNVDGVAELLDGEGKSGERGLLVPAGDHDSLARAIERTLSRSNRVMDMATSAQDHVKEQLTWEACGVAFERLYAELTAT